MPASAALRRGPLPPFGRMARLMLLVWTVAKPGAPPCCDELRLCSYGGLAPGWYPCGVDIDSGGE